MEKLPLVLFASISCLCLLPQTASADISDEWRKSNEQRILWTNDCQRRWDEANYIDVSLPPVTGKIDASYPYRWIVSRMTAAKISLYGRKVDQCFPMGPEKIGIERKTKCFDVNAYAIPDKEARRERIYDCVTLLKMESDQLIEYRKSTRFGFERKVVGVPREGTVFRSQ